MAKKLALVSGVPRMVEESASLPSIYRATYAVGSTISTGTPVTLPAAETYSSDELEIDLNGVGLDVVTDYNYVGAGPSRTQVTFTFDLVAGDEIGFKKMRNI